MSFVRNLLQVQERTVHITTKRATRNLAESRLILAALQKFGEVVHFRNTTLHRTKNEHIQDLVVSPSPKKKRENSSKTRATKGDGPDFGIYVMFDSPLAARNALDSSPLHVDLSPSSPQAKNGVANAHAASADDATEAITDAGAHSNIECTISQEPFDHIEIMSRNPYHGPFLQETDSPVYKDLIKQLEERLHGLADAPIVSKKPENPKKMKSAQESIRRLRAASLMSLWWLGKDTKANGHPAEEQSMKTVERQEELEKPPENLPLEKMIAEKIKKMQAQREEKEKQNEG
ncbi:hypothetical protein BDW66DRAFT_119862 [Aspergillus desertorum]